METRLDYYYHCCTGCQENVTALLYNKATLILSMCTEYLCMLLTKRIACASTIIGIRQLALNLVHKLSFYSLKALNLLLVFDG